MQASNCLLLDAPCMVLFDCGRELLASQGPCCSHCRGSSLQVFSLCNSTGPVALATTAMHGHVMAQWYPCHDQHGQHP